MADDVDAMPAAVMAEIHAADQREVRAIAAFELAANRRAAAVLDAALTAGGGRPVYGWGCSTSTSRPTRSPAATAPPPGLRPRPHRDRHRARRPQRMDLRVIAEPAPEPTSTRSTACSCARNGGWDADDWYGTTRVPADR